MPVNGRDRGKAVTMLLWLLAWAGCAGLSGAASEATQYIIVVRSPGRGMSQERPETINPAGFREVLAALPNRPDSSVQSGVGFIFSCFRTPPEKTVAALQNFLRAAEETATPIVVHLDVEHWWGARPDLWNWWDPTRPGFNADNRLNVEWTSWSPDDALKIAWRNWGRQLRVLPPPNLSSPRFRAACREEIRRLVPVILRWHAALPAAKKHLLVAIKVGHETSIGTNAYYYPNGNELLDRPAADDPKIPLVDQDVLARGRQQIGYAAVATAGLRTSGTIGEEDLFEATRRFLEFLCRETAECGVPRARLFSHAGGWARGEMLFDAAVNDYACPGWSFYRHAADPSGEPGVVRNLAQLSAPYWGAVEWLLQGTTDRAKWNAALTQTLADPRCRFVCIFNWEGIRQSDEVLAAIRDRTAAGSVRSATGP